MSAQNLEIFPVNGSHYVSRGGEPIDEHNSQSSLRPATSVRMGQSAVLVETHVHVLDW